MSIYSNVFTNEEIEHLNALPEVLAAKANLEQRRMVYFTISLTPFLREALHKTGLHLNDVSEIPMRWIQGDTEPHIDVGSSVFENTYLVYVNDSDGQFVLENTEYPITGNTAFVFNEGLMHKTQNTGTQPRLLIGPMNELANPVGNPFTPQSLNFFPTQADAQNITNLIYQNSAFYIRNLNQDPGGYSQTYSAWIVDPTYSISLGYNSTPYTLGEDLPVDAYTPGDGFAQYYLYPAFLIYYGSVHDIIYDINQLDNSATSYQLSSAGGHTYWLIHSSSTGTSPQSGVYAAGDTLATGGTYYLYPSPLLTYYATHADALSKTNPIGTSGYTVGTFGGSSLWKIASNSTGSSSQSTTYSSGNDLNSDGVYYLYPNAPCFLEGTQILCQINGIDTYVLIELMIPGMLVKTLHGYKKVKVIGKGTIHNPGNKEHMEDRLYHLSPVAYPTLRSDLYVTGAHSILVDTLTDKQRQKTIEHMKAIYATDKKYRLLACIDERAEPWNSEGVYSIWHVALEHEDPKMNYGIYANGLLVESCSINFLTNHSNMKLL